MDLQFFVPFPSSHSGSTISGSAPLGSATSGSATGNVPSHVSPSSANISNPPTIPPSLITVAACINSSDTSMSLPHGNTHPMITRSKIGIHKPKLYTTTKHPFPSDVDFVPTTYLQTSKPAYWRFAMQDEFNALQFRHLDLGSFISFTKCCWFQVDLQNKEET